MDAISFERIKRSVEKAKMESAEARGRQNAISEKWKREYGFDDLSSAKLHLERLMKEKAAKESKRNELMTKLVALYESKVK